MRRVLSLLILVLPVCSWSFDFKGIAVGKTATPDEIQQRLGVNCGVGYAAMQVCNGNVTVARESASINLVINPEGIVQRIALSLSPDAFDDVAPELIRKFGNPSSTSRSIVQNRMGAKYPQIVHLWSATDGTQVLYMKYAGTLERSSLNFTTEADRAMLSKGKESRSGDI
ncbi:MAG: hypothetical protein Q7U13_03030 [Rhodoferax sp.]|nr:hypothetical protein [Rhodoferax sp.]